jgi:outer membrane immunogenic protein
MATGVSVKNWWLASFVLCGLALGGPVRAADVVPGPTVYGPPAVPAAPVFTWTGFYIGGNMGYGFGHFKVDLTNGVSTLSSSVKLNGIVGGGQAGFNWQVGHFLLGLETDFQGTSQRHDATFFGIETEKDTIPWFGTTRARLGVAFRRWLFYATAGVAYGEVRREFTGVLVETILRQRVGWAAGVGVEWAVWNALTVRLEYLHIDTGKVDELSVAAIAQSTRWSDDVVRVGVNYLFNFGGPVVARY